MTTVYDFTARDITGQDVALSGYAGKVLMIVNVASRCGLTPQYAALEALYRAHEGQGFAVLGFPCNQFMGQEPGSEAEIQEFCRTNYDVTFPLFSKIEVNGPGRHPLYTYLAGDGAAFPGDIAWNFEKFLIDRHGAPVARFAPKTAPDDTDLVAALTQALQA